MPLLSPAFSTPTSLKVYVHQASLIGRLFCVDDDIGGFYLDKCSCKKNLETSVYGMGKPQDGCWSVWVSCGYMKVNLMWCCRCRQDTTG